jgi:hypothetical protein
MWSNWWTELGLNLTGGVLARNTSAFPLSVSYPRTEPQLVADAVHAFYTNNEVDSALNVIESPQLMATLSSLRTTLSDKRVQDQITDSLFVKKGKKWLNLGSILKSTQDRLTRSQKKILERAFGPYGKGLSGVYLAYSFGIAPLISDMKKVSKACQTLKADMKKGLNSAGKSVSIRRGDSGTISYVNASTGVNLGSSYTSGYQKWSISSGPCKRTVTVRGYRSNQYSTKALAEADYLLSRFGATGPVALGWELIPFSFVVDWFVDLRNITDRLDNLITGSTKKILDVCVSEKYDTTSYLSFYSTNATHSDLGTMLYQEQEKYYRRDRVTSYNITGWSGKFGKKQLSLAGALLHQTMANYVLRLNRKK